MRVSFSATRDHASHVEDARMPLVTLSCLLALAVGLVVVEVRLGGRLALITAAFAAVSLTTRIPRILAITAGLCLVVAAIAVLDVPTSTTTVHALMHAGTGGR